MFVHRLPSICVGRDHSTSVGVGVPVDGGQHARPGRRLRHAAGTTPAAADAEAHQDRDRVDYYGLTAITMPSTNRVNLVIHKPRDWRNGLLV